MQDAKQRYTKMCANLDAGDYDIVVRTMLREGLAQTEEVARQKLDAFFQWFSILADGGRHQMTERVDKAWHAMVINTEIYRKFCDEFVGQFVDHNPADVQANSNEQKSEYARKTLARLQKVFGDSMNILLADLDADVTCCCGCITPRTAEMLAVS